MRWCGSFSGANGAGNEVDEPVLTILSMLIVLQPADAGAIPPPKQKHEQSLGAMRCTLIVPEAPVPLAGELAVTLRIEGPSPLDVDIPPDFGVSSNWQARRKPPHATTTLADEREQWEQTFFFEPFAFGEAVPLTLPPIRVRSGNEIRDWTLTWEPLKIHVTSDVPDADLSFAKPVTMPDRLPPLPAWSRWHWILGCVLALAIVVAGVSGYAWLRARARTPALSPLERALAALERIDPPSSNPWPTAANALRRYFEEQYAIPATRLTSSEAIAAIAQAQLLSDERLQVIEVILFTADLVKFAGASVVKDLDPVAASRSVLLSTPPPPP